MKGKEKEQLYQKRNYDHYRFSMKELLKYRTKQIIFPLIFGFIMFFGSICFLLFKEKGETSLEWYNILL